MHKRLQCIAGWIIPGKPVADIGADHGLLAFYLLEQNLVPKVIVTEIGGGPGERLHLAVSNQKCRWGTKVMHERLEVRIGKGLRILHFGEVDTVVLAGMGGHTIVDIISENTEQSASFKRMVMQPMSKAEVMRRWCAQNGWEIVGESILEEEHKLFLIIVCEPSSKPYVLTPLEMELGPVLLKRSDPLARIYQEMMLRKFKVIVDRVALTKQEHQKRIGLYYQVLIDELEDLLCK